MSTLWYYIGEMPKPKPKKTKPVQIRLNPEELVMLEADHLEMMKLSGMPVTFSAYMKHAATSFPRLRKFALKHGAP